LSDPEPSALVRASPHPGLDRRYAIARLLRLGPRRSRHVCQG